MPLPKPKSGESQDDFIDRCMSNATMKKDFPDNDQRLAVCHSQWRGKASSRSIELSIRGLAASPRDEELNGKPYLAVPVIALVEGVVWPSNAPSPELALASEFGSVAQGWDGRPVLVGHPQRNGQQVSANSPDIWDSEVIGQLFNTKVEDKKLKTEAWLDLGKVEELGGDVKEIVDSLRDGEVVEVSTGLFADIEPKQGRFNGEEFNGVWTNVIPDHLAILPPGTVGACSIEDGCGTNRTNMLTLASGEVIAVGYREGVSLCASCGAAGKECSCEMKEITLDDLELDIPDVATDLYEQAFDTKEEPEGRRAARLAAYGLMDNKGPLGKFLAKLRGSLTDIDRRRALDAALAGSGQDFFFVTAVEESFFIYEKGWDGAMFSQQYRIEDDGTVVLVGKASRVRPETSFVPVKVQTEDDEEEDDDMEKEKRVQALIDNSSTKFTADDKEWLMGLEEDYLVKMEPEAPLDDGGNEDDEPADGETVEQFLERTRAPVALREVIEGGLKVQRELRDSLTATIKANKKNKFSDEELARMPISSLQRISALAERDDFAGQGGPRFQEDDPLFAPKPRGLFEKKED